MVALLVRALVDFDLLVLTLTVTLLYILNVFWAAL